MCLEESKCSLSTKAPGLHPRDFIQYGHFELMLAQPFPLPNITELINKTFT